MTMLETGPCLVGAAREVPLHLVLWDGEKKPSELKRLELIIWICKSVYLSFLGNCSLQLFDPRQGLLRFSHG